MHAHQNSQVACPEWAGISLDDEIHWSKLKLELEAMHIWMCINTEPYMYHSRSVSGHSDLSCMSHHVSDHALVIKAGGAQGLHNVDALISQALKIVC